MAKEEEKTPKIAKARYWWAVLYQEHAPGLAKPSMI